MKLKVLRIGTSVKGTDWAIIGREAHGLITEKLMTLRTESFTAKVGDELEFTQEEYVFLKEQQQDRE